MKTLIVSRVVAEHESASEFNRELAAVVDKRARLMQQLEAEASKLYAKMGKEYTYEVKDALVEPFLPREAKLGKPLRLIRTWANKAEWDRVAKTYGVAGSGEPGVAMSPVYYRVNGVIVYVNQAGVEHMLKVNVPCSDSQWEMLQSGHIPVELLKE